MQPEAYQDPDPSRQGWYEEDLSAAEKAEIMAQLGPAENSKAYFDALLAEGDRQLSQLWDSMPILQRIYVILRSPVRVPLWMLAKRNRLAR